MSSVFQFCRITTLHQTHDESGSLLSKNKIKKRPDNCFHFNTLTSACVPFKKIDSLFLVNFNVIKEWTVGLEKEKQKKQNKQNKQKQNQGLYFFGRRLDFVVWMISFVTIFAFHLKVMSKMI